MSAQAVAPGGTRPAEELSAPRQVVFLGPPPAGAEELGIEVVSVSSAAEAARGGPALVHVTDAAVDVAAVRRLAPQAALVVEVNGERRLGFRERRSLQAADMLIVSDTLKLGPLGTGLMRRAAVIPPSLDLERFAPAKRLSADRKQDARLKRFRRLHRLVGPTILFAGPYTPAGRLDILLDAVYAIREHIPELRVAAVPHGSVDARFLDRCERRALGLGHHGVVEWQRVEEDLPLWYALCTVVCSPGLAGLEPARLAAAAARPYIASSEAAGADAMRDGSGGFVIDPDAPDALQAALEGVLGDGEEADRVGVAARERAERDLGADSYARRVHRVWDEALDRRANVAERTTGRA